MLYRICLLIAVVKQSWTRIVLELEMLLSYWCGWRIPIQLSLEAGELCGISPTQPPCGCAIHLCSPSWGLFPGGRGGSPGGTTITSLLKKLSVTGSAAAATKPGRSWVCPLEAGATFVWPGDKEERNKRIC